MRSAVVTCGRRAGRRMASSNEPPRREPSECGDAHHGDREHNEEHPVLRPGLVGDDVERHHGQGSPRATAAERRFNISSSLLPDNSAGRAVLEDPDACPWFRVVKTSELRYFQSDPRHIFQVPGDGLSSSARRTRPAIATCRSSDHSVALNRMSYTFASLPEQPNHAAADPPFAMMLGAPALVSRRIAAQVPPELC